MMSEKEYEFNLEFIGDVFIREVHGYKLKEYDFYKDLQTLVKEHFELVEKHNTLLSRYNALNHQQAYKFEDLGKGSEKEWALAVF